MRVRISFKTGRFNLGRLFQGACRLLFWLNRTRVRNLTAMMPLRCLTTRLYALLALTLFTGQPRTSAGSARAEHVVVVVWDGMRPDFIDPRYTPTLCQLATNGVFFNHHHSVYISTTEANAAAIATGANPDHNGIIANKEYRPLLNWLEPVATASVDAIRRGDVLSSGRYLTVPTLAEILQGTGNATVVAGSKSVVLLQDRALQRSTPGALNSLLLYSGHTIPSALLEPIIKANGRTFPTNASVGPRDAWTVQALTETLWKPGVPKFSLLWLIDPDSAQHGTGPGSANSLKAIRSCDTNLALVLQALEARQVRQKTDVFVVSDHGFSTVQRGVDVVEVLRKAGFPAVKKLEDPEPGNILVVSLGGSELFYVLGHDENIIRRLVQFLQGTDFAGVIFTRKAMPGTFSLDQVRLAAGQNQPDIVVSLRWSSETNNFGVQGTIVADRAKKGTGIHGSLSRYDMHNSLVAAGPDFRPGYWDDLPSSNADLAPTILWILEKKRAKTMDGRILTEAMTDARPSATTPRKKTLETSCDVGGQRWRQYLRVTAFEGRDYFDEGNGEGSVDSSWNPPCRSDNQDYGLRASR